MCVFVHKVKKKHNLKHPTGFHDNILTLNRNWAPLAVTDIHTENIRISATFGSARRENFAPRWDTTPGCPQKHLPYCQKTTARTPRDHQSKPTACLGQATLRKEDGNDFLQMT